MTPEVLPLFDIAHESTSAGRQQVESAGSSGTRQSSAGVAHELNNPVSDVKSNLNRLDRFTRSITAHIAHLREALRRDIVPEEECQPC